MNDNVKKFEPNPDHAFTLTLSPEGEKAAMKVYATLQHIGGLNLDSIRLMIANIAMAHDIHAASHPSVGGAECNIDRVLIQHTAAFTQLLAAVPIDESDYKNQPEELAASFYVYFKFVFAGVIRAWIQLHLRNDLPPPTIKPRELFADAITTSRTFSAKVFGGKNEMAFATISELMQFLMEGGGDDKPAA